MQKSAFSKLFHFVFENRLNHQRLRKYDNLDMITSKAKESFKTIIWFEICLCLTNFRFAFRKLKADQNVFLEHRLHFMIKMPYEFY